MSQPVLSITGEVVSIGDISADEAPNIVGVPHVGIKLTSGRLVTVIGVSREECRALAPLFMDNVAVRFSRSAP